MPYIWHAVKLQSICSTAMRKRRNTETEKSGLTKTGVKKTLWLHEDEAESLRIRAFQERRSEASIIREALRRYLSLED